MALLKLRDRHRTVKSLNMILSSMQVVTTVQIQRLKERQAHIDRYLACLAKVLAGRKEDRSLPRKKALLLTSSRGLCGDFDKKAMEAAETFASRFPQAEIVPLTSRGAVCLHGKFCQQPQAGDDELRQNSFEEALVIFRRVFDPAAEFYIVYNQYHGSINLRPTVYRLYPLPEELQVLAEPAGMILEPRPELLIGSLFEHYLEMKFFALLLNSRLGELTARLLSLNNSVKNSRDLQQELQLKINKTRQAAITRELTEVVASAEILRRESDE